jgi:hypothetical protein
MKNGGDGRFGVDGIANRDCKISGNVSQYAFGFDGLTRDALQKGQVQLHDVTGDGIADVVVLDPDNNLITVCEGHIEPLTILVHNSLLKSSSGRRAYTYRLSRERRYRLLSLQT